MKFSVGLFLIGKAVFVRMLKDFADYISLLYGSPLVLVLCAFMVGGWQVDNSRVDKSTADNKQKGQISRDGSGAVEISRAPAMEGVLIVKFKSTVPGKSAASGIASFDQLAQVLEPTALRQLFPSITPLVNKAGVSTDISLVQALSFQHIYELHYNAEIPPHIAAAVLSSDPNVAYAEPRYLYRITGFIEDSPVHNSVEVMVEPNDPQFSEMSHLSHIRLPQAWDVVKSSEGNVIIGVVDAGTDWRHEDLVANIWHNPGERDDNGTDDDSNGFIDDVRGWNFANNTNDPTGLVDTEANATHGTLVAGIASAVTNNEEGIAGASWNARLMPVNAGCANSDNAVCFGFEGMLYAAMQGADIINASWGGPDSFLGREVVKMALDLGVLLVVSAGNGTGVTPEGINIDENLTFPASYDRVLVVGSTGKRVDLKADFSNFGVGVDVFAPGVTLNSTIPDNGYSTLASGTSFSTPIVAGLASLLKTRHPEWSLDQIREQIRVTSDPIDATNPSEYNGLLGRGRVNAFRALSNTTIPSLRVRKFDIIDSGNDGIIQSGELIVVNVEMVNYLAVAQNIKLTLSIDDPDVVIQNGSFSLADLDSGIPITVQFAFSFSNDVPKDHEMNFRIDVQGDGYADAELIRLIANRATHDTGVLQMSLTDEGNIGWKGFQDESEGQGFKYLGVNWLFEGGVLIGTGPDKISDSVRNTEDNQQDVDLNRPEGAFFGILESSSVAENGLVILNDDLAENPLGIKIHQESYADDQDENNDFIILRYVVSHSNPQATSAIQDLYIGLLTDWDLTRSGDYATFDADRRLGIVQPSATEPVLLLATKLLNENIPFSYRSIDNDEIFDSRSDGDGFTNNEKWAFMTDGIQVEQVNNEDVSTLITAGPFRLNPGDEVEAAFALMAARNENELAAFADQAQLFWDNTLALLPPYPVDIEEEELTSIFSLDPPFPNPVDVQSSINYTLPAAGFVYMAVYDVLGREVKTLVNDSRAAGRHMAAWDGRNHNDEFVSNGVYFYRINASTAQGNYTATHKIVLVH